MRWQDAIELTQQLERVCMVPGLLERTWGSHGLSAEGVIGPNMPINMYAKPSVVDRYARTHLHGLFARADPYFVDTHLLGLIEASANSLPDDVKLQPRLFRSMYGCLFFERPVNGMIARRLHDVIGRPDLPMYEPAPLSGFAWQTDDTGVVLVFFYSWAVDNNTPNYFGGTYVGNIPLSITPWDFGATTLGSYVKWHNDQIIDEDRSNAERFAHSARLAVATLLLMDQTLTVINGSEVDRAARKRATRAGWTNTPTVQVVTLRKVERINPYAVERGDVEWHCRWSVRRHWRVLHRGTPVERTVLVHEHLKGPEGLPFKAPNPRVFAVVE